MIKNTIYGIKNLIKYFKIIWYDRDWDYLWLILFIKAKLKSQHKFLSSDKAVAIHTKKELNRILEIISHINHWEDIDKYTKYEFPDREFIELENGNFGMKPLSKVEVSKLMKNHNLENWHFQQIFVKLGKHIHKFWD